MRAVAANRRLVFVLAALVIGGGLGYLLDLRQPPPMRAHSTPPRLLSLTPVPAPRPAAPPAAARITPVPAAPSAAESRAPAPSAGASAQPGPAPTPHNEPHVLYEEPLKNGGPALGEGGARKPILAGELAALAARPLLGPKPLWAQNARPMPELGNHPIIALIIDDSGVDRRRTERAVEHLPAAVTMSFMTYAPEVAEQVAAARARGHEIMVHVPMEPENARIDPGPRTLYVGESADEIERRLDWDLSRFDGYVAINNHMGSKFTRDPAGMAVVLRALKARGVFFVDSRTTGGSVGTRLAQEIGVPHLERDVFLDNVDTREEVTSRLAELERIARRDGYAIAIGHPRDATLDVLERWTRRVQDDGFVLVPVSTVMRLRLAADQAHAAAAAAVRTGG